MDLIRATDQKYLLYGSQIKQDIKEGFPPVHSGHAFNIWDERFVLIEGNMRDAEYWHFTVFDLLMNESRSIRFIKSDVYFRSARVHSWKGNLGFFVESKDNFCYVSLIKINLALCEVHVVETFHREGHFMSFITNNLEPSTFIMTFHNAAGLHTHQFCKLVGKNIQFGAIHELGYSFTHYFKDKLLGFQLDIRGEQEGQDEEQEGPDEQAGQNVVEIAIRTFDTITKHDHTFPIAQLPDDLVLTEFCGWINDRLYFGVTSRRTNTHRVAWTDTKTLRWTILDEIATNLGIHKAQFFNDNLFIVANQRTVCVRCSIAMNLDFLNGSGFIESKVKFYSIPMRRPQALRVTTWLSIVKTMERKEYENPRKIASKYLSLITDLRSPWFDDTEDEEDLATARPEIDFDLD